MRRDNLLVLLLHLRRHLLMMRKVINVAIERSVVQINIALTNERNVVLSVIPRSVHLSVSRIRGIHLSVSRIRSVTQRGVHPNANLLRGVNPLRSVSLPLHHLIPMRNVKISRSSTATTNRIFSETHVL